MLLKLAHKLASHAWVYDRIQSAAGVSQVYEKLAPHLRNRNGPANTLVVDVGGGTGSLKNHCPPGARYLCLDIEEGKLAGFRRKFPEGLAIRADATRLPLAPGSVDTAVCMFIAHHLNDNLLPGMLGEVERALRPGGRLILIDPVLDETRMAGRVLWKLDRGSFPRSAARLTQMLEQHFRIEHRDEFAVWHRYLLGIARKRSSSITTAPARSATRLRPSHQ